jgi:hypothetical protein
MNDILRAFHHPSLRDEHLEIHRNMFNTVRKWVDEQPNRNSFNHVLGSASVKAGRNHSGDGKHNQHNHGALGGHGKTSGSIWSEIKTRDLGAMAGDDTDFKPSYISSPQSHSPAMPTQSFGYQNNDPRPGSANRPHMQGGYLNPDAGYGGYHGGPAPSTYQQNTRYGQEPPSFGMPPGPPETFGSPQPPYPNEPPYGSSAPYPGGYDQGYQQGPPPGIYQQGPPPPQGNWQSAQSGYPGAQQPQPPYPGQYQGQGQPTYYPPGGGGYGY